MFTHFTLNYIPKLGNTCAFHHVVSVITNQSLLDWINLLLIPSRPTQSKLSNFTYITNYDNIKYQASYWLSAHSFRKQCNEINGPETFVAITMAVRVQLHVFIAKNKCWPDCVSLLSCLRRRSDIFYLDVNLLGICRTSERINEKSNNS